MPKCKHSVCIELITAPSAYGSACGPEAKVTPIKYMNGSTISPLHTDALMWTHVLNTLPYPSNSQDSKLTSIKNTSSYNSQGNSLPSKQHSRQPQTTLSQSSCIVNLVWDRYKLLLNLCSFESVSELMHLLLLPQAMQPSH